MSVETAFVLGGGGRWGAVEVGMLQALDEADIRPDLVLGTSIGAFNGSVIADDPGSVGVKRLGEMWEEVSSVDLFRGNTLGRVRNLATLQPALHRSAELQLVLEHAHGGPGKRIEDLAVPFQCVAASIERAAEHWFASGPLIPALLATSAVPVLFPPVEIDGEHFYDGGLVNSVPLGRAVKSGASVIYVLQVGRLEAPLRAPERLHEAALISFEIARRNRYATAMENLPDDVEVHVLPSGNPVEFDDRRQLRWRDTAATTELAGGAYKASRAYLEEKGLW
ncbi:MAG: patatin-like phospholipase family protein [Actinomycetota bacterium]|nr:patatin-like phospholipase family protein [Actinomycetota bacterium]